MARRKGLLARFAPTGAVERTLIARASAEDAFAVASSYGVRLDWDPFVSAQHLGLNSGRVRTGQRQAE